MKLIRHFVKEIDGETVYLVYIEMEDGKGYEVAFNKDGEHTFVDACVWESIKKEL